MRVDEFDFALPPECIALRPAARREDARLLVVRGRDAPFEDRTIGELAECLRPDDFLVFNDTRVVPARLVGVRTGRGDTSPKVEINLHKRDEGSRWRAFARPARKLEPGDSLLFGDPADLPQGEGLAATVLHKHEGGEIEIEFSVAANDLEAALARHGTMPLPPYIASRRTPDVEDDEDYQTIFANEAGAVAAPTAGLHFTPQLMSALAARGIEHCTLTLHVGAGTFLPVKSDETEGHRMHSEYGRLDGETAALLNKVRAAGRRIVAVGTTSLRLLESAATPSGEIRPFDGDTDIFITPGYRFRATDVLLTNFHLPRSTLFMLVSAFCGLDRMKEAYAHAIEAGYRFYSYGDACLLERVPER